MWVKMFFLSFYSSKSCHLSEYTLKYFGGLFTRVLKFSRFKNKFNLKFGFLLQHFATFLFDFPVWCFKMEFNSLPELLDTKLTIIEIGLFYGGEHLEAKICRFLTFFWQDGDAYLASRKSCFTHVLKHLKYWLSSPNILLRQWAYFPKYCWWILKQGNLFFKKNRFKFQFLTTSVNISLFALKSSIF